MDTAFQPDAFQVNAYQIVPAGPGTAVGTVEHEHPIVTIAVGSATSEIE